MILNLNNELNIKKNDAEKNAKVLGELQKVKKYFGTKYKKSEY